MYETAHADIKNSDLDRARDKGWKKQFFNISRDKMNVQRIIKCMPPLKLLLTVQICWLAECCFVLSANCHCFLSSLIKILKRRLLLKKILSPRIWNLSNSLLTYSSWPADGVVFNRVIMELPIENEGVCWPTTTPIENRWYQVKVLLFCFAEFF